MSLPSTAGVGRGAGDGPRLAITVCVHCGHVMEHHGRRLLGAAMRYRCHEGNCTCNYDLLYVE
jgi:hypothetical protein